MSSIRNHRAALVQAEQNDRASTFVFLEIFGLGALVGWVGGNWFNGIVIGIILMVFLLIPYVRVLVSLVLSFAWAVIAGIAVTEGFDQSENAAIAAAIVAGLIALGVHLGFLEWSKDMDAKDEPEKQQQVSIENTSSQTGTKEGLSASDIECPVCAEWIKAKALKCRFCGHPMVSAPAP